MNIIFKTKMSNHHLYPNQSDSTSLWNYSLFPGWSEEEVEVLKIALIKYGIGHWTRIQKVNCLPGKTIVQMYLQTQRLIGQQSLAEFMGLHVNLEKIFSHLLQIFPVSTCKITENFLESNLLYLSK